MYYTEVKMFDTILNSYDIGPGWYKKTLTVKAKSR